MEPVQPRLTLGPYSAGDLVLLRSVVPLHPGVGRGGEEVDLAIQRDGLGFPIIYSSSIKGALKSMIWRLDQRKANLLLGPETEEEKFASALSILDCFLLIMPVRSLVGIYAFLTTPLLLRRFYEIMDFAEAVGIKNLKELKDSVRQVLKDSDGLKESTIVSSSDKLKVDALNGKLVINEELWLQPIEKDSVEDLESKLKIEKGRLVVVNDDSGLSAINRSILRVTRVRIGRETKTVEGRGLWTEEHVPHDAFFYTVFFYSRSYNEALDSADKVRNEIRGLINEFGNYLIIGGHETVGRGIVKLKFWG
ncbi:MAG: type III-B CRISPR module RAMP protein Cmr4 [Candidatus Bathyarchaeia archaeon]